MLSLDAGCQRRGRACYDARQPVSPGMWASAPPQGTEAALVFFRPRDLYPEARVALAFCGRRASSLIVGADSQPLMPRRLRSALGRVHQR